MTKTQSLPYGEYRYRYNILNGSWVPEYSRTGDTTVSSATYTKGIPTMTRNGYEFITPYSYRRSLIYRATGSVTTYRYGRPTSGSMPTWYPERKEVYLNSFTGSVSYDPIPSWEVLTQRALAKLDSEGDSTNMEMLTKDLIDAMRMTGEYGQRLLAAIPYLKKGKFSKAWKAFNRRRGQLYSNRKVISNEWLAFQWGVKPSIDAVINAYNLATSSDEKRTFRVTSVSSAHSTVYCNVHRPGDTSMVKEAIGNLDISVKLIRYFKNMSEKDYAKLWNNPATPAWDAIPYSFLLDWFVPIGDYLKQFSYYNRNTYNITGCDCRLYKLIYNYSVTSEYAKLSRSVYDMSDYKQITFERRLSSAIHASYTLGDIVDNSAFGLTRGRLLNLFALCNQKIR